MCRWSNSCLARVCAAWIIKQGLFYHHTGVTSTNGSITKEKRVGLSPAERMYVCEFQCANNAGLSIKRNLRNDSRNFGELLGVQFGMRTKKFCECISTSHWFIIRAGSSECSSTWQTVYALYTDSMESWWILSLFFRNRIDQQIRICFFHNNGVLQNNGRRNLETFLQDRYGNSQRCKRFILGNTKTLWSGEEYSVQVYIINSQIAM